MHIYTLSQLTEHFNGFFFIKKVIYEKKKQYLFIVEQEANKKKEQKSPGRLLAKCKILTFVSIIFLKFWMHFQTVFLEWHKHLDSLITWNYSLNILEELL